VLELRELPEDRLPARREEVTQRLADLRVRTQYADPEAAREDAAALVERRAARSRQFDVVEEGQPVGFLWWFNRGEESSVEALVMDQPPRVGELLPHLVELAREDGSRVVSCSAVPGEPAREQLVAQPGFVARATNMALPLDGVIGDPGGLALRPMTQDEFDDYMADSVELYIDELVAGGMSREAAQQQGEEQIAELIPDGLASPDQQFFAAVVDDTYVGHLWISTQREMAFVYDIAVHEDQRRKGYGEAIMNAGALWSRDHGHVALGLNVFAHNPNARALYDKLGYRVTLDFRTYDIPDA
jgi:GNAT superfamily N-acetyltransferase